MTKIIQVITRLDKGGSADLVLHTCALQVKKGYEVVLISGKTNHPQYDLKKFADSNGFNIIFIDSLVRNVNPITDFKALYHLWKIFRKKMPDIIHTNTSKAGFIGRIAAKIAGIKKIYHSPHGHIFYGYYSNIITKIFILMEKFAALFSTKILTLTEKGRQDHIREKIATPDKIVVSSCGVDLSNFRQFSVKSFPNKAIRILWIGRFVSIKNPQMVIDVARIPENSKYQFTMLGDGELWDKIKNKAQDLTNIEFPGFQQNLVPFLEEAELFIITSLNEGFGRVIVEAMAAGLPIVATDVGGISEIIEDNINGFLVQTGDSQAMSDKIKQLLNNPQQYAAMSDENIHKSQHYSMKNYLNNIFNIYEAE